MGTWNHRVMRHKHTFPESGETEVTLAIHEVYYKDQTVDDCQVSADDVGFTENAVTVTGESIEELRSTLRLMLNALDKPVLEYKQHTESTARGLELLDKLDSGALTQQLEIQEKIRKLRGCLKWEGNLDQTRGGDEESGK